MLELGLSPENIEIHFLVHRGRRRRGLAVLAESRDTRLKSGIRYHLQTGEGALGNPLAVVVEIAGEKLHHDLPGLECEAAFA